MFAMRLNLIANRFSALYLGTFRDGPEVRAWKGFDWGSMDRLHEKGFIHDPKSKARSVILTEEGEWATRELFERHFGR